MRKSSGVEYRCAFSWIFKDGGLQNSDEPKVHCPRMSGKYFSSKRKVLQVFVYKIIFLHTFWREKSSKLSFSVFCCHLTNFLLNEIRLENWDRTCLKLKLSSSCASAAFSQYCRWLLTNESGRIQKSLSGEPFTGAPLLGEPRALVHWPCTKQHSNQKNLSFHR